MSVQKEEYIIHGCKFGSKFTNDFWKKDFRDEQQWDEDKDDEPYFLSDGMSGDYTFFGFIEQLSDGFDEENTDIIEFEAPTQEQKDAITKKFQGLYPDTELPPIKMYYVPHYT